MPLHPLRPPSQVFHSFWFVGFPCRVRLICQISYLASSQQRLHINWTPLPNSAIFLLRCLSLAFFEVFFVTPVEVLHFPQKPALLLPRSARCSSPFLTYKLVSCSELVTPCCEGPFFFSRGLDAFVPGNPCRSVPLYQNRGVPPKSPPPPFESMQSNAC